MLFAQVEGEALKLSEQERAVLAEHLLSSLDASLTGLNEERWLDEAERRYQAYKVDPLPARDADDVFHDAERVMG